jgi:hypothetical protein
MQDTPKSQFLVPASEGVGTTDQVLPFQDSTRGCTSPPLFLKYPTAVHEVRETHDTPSKRLPVVLTLGVGTIDQAVPFHVSTRARW